MMDIKERLREARKARGMKQADLAERMGVRKNTVSAWETGQNRPDMDDVERLCGILDVSPSWMLGVDDDLAVSPSEMALIKKIRQLPGPSVALVRQMVDQLLGGVENGD